MRVRRVWRRTAPVNQIRAFLIEQGITVRRGLAALRTSLLIILKNRADEISSRMHKSILDRIRIGFGAWLEPASTRLQHNKSSVALANKLARITWGVLHSGRVFSWKENELAAAV